MSLVQYAERELARIQKDEDGMQELANRDILEIVKAFSEQRHSRMSCRPAGLSKVPDNHIFDEDKSVKWNKEQVERNNQQYRDEVARLNTERNRARDNVLELIYDKIQYEVGHGISRKKAQAIWDYAYEKGHAFGFISIQLELSDIIDLIDILLEDGE